MKKSHHFSACEPHIAPRGEGAGDALKRLRRQIGMKQGDLSLLSGVAQTTISRIECGLVTPYPKTLWRLADALDAFGCEDATDRLCGDWCPGRGK